MESLLLSCKALSSSTTCRFIPAHVAVGTAIADRPPHRSVRAALPHTALTLDDGIEANFTSRTPRNPWDTDFPALCRARVEFRNILLGPRSSLHHLRRGQPLLFVRQLHRYYSAVRPLNGVPVRLAAYRLPGPVPYIAGHR